MWGADLNINWHSTNLIRIILNKKSDLWGSDGYSEAEDAVRLVAKPKKAASASEKMTFAVAPDGKVSLMWGTVQVDFNVE